MTTKREESVVNTPSAVFSQSISFCADGCAKSTVPIVPKLLEFVTESRIQFTGTRRPLSTRSVPTTTQMCPRAARTRTQMPRVTERTKTANGSHVDFDGKHQFLVRLITSQEDKTKLKVLVF